MGEQTSRKDRETVGDAGNLAIFTATPAYDVGEGSAGLEELGGTDAAGDDDACRACAIGIRASQNRGERKAE